MEINQPRIISTGELQPGELFYHLSAGPAALFLAVSFSTPDAANLDLRLVPLHFPKSPTMVGMPIFEQHFEGKAFVIEGCCAELIPSSVCASDTPGQIIASDGRLLLPFRGDRGMRGGQFDIATGYLSSWRHDFVWFDAWRIVQTSDPENVIWESSEEADG